MSSKPPSGLTVILTFVALIALAIASWLLSSAGTGTGVAMAIAGAKALLIALFFMELVCAPAVDRTIAVVAVLFVLLLCAGALADVAYR